MERTSYRTQLRCAILVVLASFLLPICKAATDKPRVIVLTDIGGDPDDQQSLVRLMLYSNELDIEGLIATSRGLNGHDTRPDLIFRTINAYALVRDNLLLHSAEFPSASNLLRSVKSGNPNPGMSCALEGPDTEGSEHIISVLEREDERPVWVLVWGGSCDLAHALQRIRETKSSTELKRLTRKLRIYAIGDQDGTGALIRKEYPDLFFIYAYTTSAPLYLGVPRGMYQNESGEQKLVKDSFLVSAQWAKQNVVTGHGALGAIYPLNALQTPRSSYGVKEGDSPSFLYLVSGSNGLSDPEQPSWGSWGGRFKGNGHYAGAADNHWSRSKDLILREKWTVARFRRAYQNDFQARMDWCIKPFSRANHQPLATINDAQLNHISFVTAESGISVVLDASGSSDSDGDALLYAWSVYQEAGTSRTRIPFRARNSKRLSFTAPAVTVPKALHIILEVIDNGSPRLRAYSRVIVTVVPRS